MKYGENINWIELGAWFIAGAFSLLIVYGIAGCTKAEDAGKPPVEGKADFCGYTWAKTSPASVFIRYKVEPDWRKFPKGCDEMGIRGCTSAFILDSQTISEIVLREPLETMLQEKGECNVVFHEFRHAMGYTHKEAHSYTPRDYTR